MMLLRAFSWRYRTFVGIFVPCFMIGLCMREVFRSYVITQHITGYELNLSSDIPVVSNRLLNDNALTVDTLPSQQTHRGFGVRNLPDVYNSTSKLYPVPEIDIQRLYHGVSFIKELEIAYEGGPFHYISGYESPCWRSIYKERANYYKNSWIKTYNNVHNPVVGPFLDKVETTKPSTRLRCLPSVYIVGAAGSGTSDFYQMLTRYSGGRILMAAAKEPPYWSDERGRTFRDYMDLFDPPADVIEARAPVDGIRPGITVDASTYNFNGYKDWKSVPDEWDKNEPNINYTLPRALKVLYPNTKILTILRNPAPRLLSQFRSLYSSLSEKLEWFDIRARNVLPQWTSCIEEKGFRSCSYDFHSKLKRTEYGNGIIVRESLYYPWIKEWMDVFGKEQMKVIRAEDYYSNRAKVLNEVYAFLGFDPIPQEILKELEEEQIRHNHKSSKMLNKTQVYLEEFFRPYNQMLADYLQDSRFLWDD